MISIDWFTSDHRETTPNNTERAAPTPRSLTWQPAPSPLRQVSSPVLSQHQYHSPQHSPPGLSPAIWSTLPIELVTQILLYVAFASRVDAHALCLVSSAVRRAVLPALYHNVLLRHAAQVPAFVSPFAMSTSWRPSHRCPSPSNAKLLAHIPIHALALALPTKRPSLEVALARAAPALASLEHLALTAPLLGAHAHWLRGSSSNGEQRAIQPRTLMLYHLGRPAPVHFGEPFLRCVTHLYTSTLTGFRGTSPASLPALTHIALATRAAQPPAIVDEVLASARRVLAACPDLAMLVLALDGAQMPAQVQAQMQVQELAHALGLGPSHPPSTSLGSIALPAPWRGALAQLPARQRDPRLHVLPFALHARLAWQDVIADAPDVFACARAWRDAEARGDAAGMLRLAAEVATRNTALESWKEEEWDLDLMTAPGYVHGRSADEGETDTPAVQW
ncbi:hypothetical protein BJY52DRAFT_363138 [Lactarius psammicola]|nr:hypothetical protein BJY52DRAFT_363138 [Lactarius psammicola]